MPDLTNRIQNDKLYLAESDIGKGVFSRNQLQPMERCGFLSGEAILFDEVIERSDRGCNSIQIGPGLYIEPHFPMLFVNHSCDPNVGLTDDLTLIAIRPITKGEEIRFDYSTTMYERYYTMPCACGSSICRNVIEDFDLLPDSIQKPYLELGIVQSFIQDRVSSIRASKPKRPALLSAIQTECLHSIGVDRVLSAGHL